MSFVYELLELVRCAVTARGRKKARHLITKASIIRVLHNCHKLHSIVALSLHNRQNVLAEVRVCRDLAFRWWNADMGFVDTQTRRSFRSVVLELIRLLKQQRYFSVFAFIQVDLFVNFRLRSADCRRPSDIFWCSDPGSRTLTTDIICPLFRHGSFRVQAFF